MFTLKILISQPLLGQDPFKGLLHHNRNMCALWYLLNRAAGLDHTDSHCKMLPMNLQLHNDTIWGSEYFTCYMGIFSQTFNQGAPISLSPCCKFPQNKHTAGLFENAYQIFLSPWTRFVPLIYINVAIYQDWYSRYIITFQFTCLV